MVLPDSFSVLNEHGKQPMGKKVISHFVEIKCPVRLSLGISLMTTSRSANVSLFLLERQNDANVDDFKFSIG